jgi:hypothetical protein
VYTNEGFRLEGIWRPFGESRRGRSIPWGPFGAPGKRVWEKGTCVIEFDRTCARGPPPRDLASGLTGVKVQDTDLSYRARMRVDAFREAGPGRWSEEEFGSCVDRVIRGCFNNGTCVAPNTCECALGWTCVHLWRNFLALERLLRVGFV